MDSTKKGFTIGFVNSVDTNQFKDLSMKTFHSALFVGASLWICGWNKNIFGQKNIVFLNVDSVDYDVLSKSQFKYPAADKPIITFADGDRIFFAKRDGHEIHSFNTKTHKVRRIFRTNHLTISGMCGSENYIYILDRNEPLNIQVLESGFHASDKIDTGLETLHDCQVDMYSIDDIIAISTSFPLGTVRLLNRNFGVIWDINNLNTPELPLQFNPCSVSMIPGDGILFADRYFNDIYTVSFYGKNLRNVLDRKDGIDGPTNLYVDKDEKRLLVINKDGFEIKKFTFRLVEDLFIDIPSVIMREKVRPERSEQFLLASEETSDFHLWSTTESNLHSKTGSDLNSTIESNLFNSTTELQLAYEEACSRGFNPNYRIHLTVIGHSKAGKTSFIDRLLGKEFQEQRESTEGIHTHFVQSSFNKMDLGSKIWTERLSEASIPEKDFYESVLAQREFEILKRKVKYWLQNITWVTEPNVIKGSSPQESQHSADELNQSPYRDIDYSEKVEFGLDTNSANEKLFHDDDAISQPTLPKINLNPPSDSRTESETDEENKEEFSVPEPFATPIVPKISSEESKKLYTKNNEKRIPYSVNIWDYGGQNEFIITNQLFLNIEAFILVVMDISLDLHIPLKLSSDAEGKFSIPKTPAQILCYWLNALHVLAKEKGTEPNTALVLTHQDMIKADDTKQYIDNYIEELIECIGGKPYASYITLSNIYVIDNRQGTELDFAQIRNKIFAQMRKQKSFGIERPTRWLKLEANILEKAKETEKPCLHITGVKDLASVFAMNQNELKSFLSFHHNLGDMIYYPDKKLSDIVVTNPQWLLDMFKTLITPHEFLNRRQLRPELLEELKSAIVSEASLKILWEGNDVQFLKNVMIKFDLMLPLGSKQQDKKYLIPCMLPAQEVNIDESDPFTGMALIYSSKLEPERGDAMPVGAFHNLLSQCSKTPRWTICADDHLSYNQALIEIDDGVSMELSLQKSNSIQVSICNLREKFDYGHLSVDNARDLIARAHKTTARCMKIAGLIRKGSFKMLCPYWNPGEEYICLVAVDEKKEVPQNISIFFPLTKKCAMHGKELQPGQFPWTEGDFDSVAKSGTFQTKLESMMEIQEAKDEGEAEAFVTFKVAPLLDIAMAKLDTIGTKLETMTEIQEAEDEGEADAFVTDKVSSLLDIVMGFLQTRIGIVRLIRGKPCTIQGTDSDTLLHIPGGVYAALLGNIHTNPTKFRHHIPRNDCLVAPICEYHLQPFIGRILPPRTKYIIQVPHIVRNVHEAQQFIRIRHGDIHSGSFLLVYKLEKDKYEMDKKYVTIHTSHFSGYIVTAEGINCCSKSVNVLLFGSLVNNPEIGPFVTVKVYLSSIHSQIKDYDAALRRKERIPTISLKLLTTDEIYLSKEEYNATKSKIQFQLVPMDPKKWTHIRNIPLHVEKPLDEALTFDNGHICKRFPTEIVKFYMQSTASSELFRGVVDVDLTIVKPTPNEPNNNTEQTSSHPIMVEIMGHMAGGSYVQDQRNGDGQNPNDLKMKDLSKLASKIEKNHMKRIAIEQFEIDPVDLARIADDFRDSWEFNFEILKKWWNFSRDNNHAKLASLFDAVDEGLIRSEVVVNILGVVPPQ